LKLEVGKFKITKDQYKVVLDYDEAEKLYQDLRKYFDPLIKIVTVTVPPIDRRTLFATNGVTYSEPKTTAPASKIEPVDRSKTFTSNLTKEEIWTSSELHDVGSSIG